MRLREAHWLEVRGPVPSARLAKILWGARPPLANLFMSLYAGGHPGARHHSPALEPGSGPALLVLAEIERGEAEEACRAYEVMMQAHCVHTCAGNRWAPMIDAAANCGG